MVCWKTFGLLPVTLLRTTSLWWQHEPAHDCFSGYRNQRITEPRATVPGGVVRWFGTMQAQDFGAALPPPPSGRVSTKGEFFGRI
jgi:hypothetical protein